MDPIFLFCVFVMIMSTIKGLVLSYFYYKQNKLKYISGEVFYFILHFTLWYFYPLFPLVLASITLVFQVIGIIIRENQGEIKTKVTKFMQKHQIK